MGLKHIATCDVFFISRSSLLENTVDGGAHFDVSSSTLIAGEKLVIRSIFSGCLTLKQLIDTSIVAFGNNTLFRRARIAKRVLAGSGLCFGEVSCVGSVGF